MMVEGRDISAWVTIGVVPLRSSGHERQICRSSVDRRKFCRKLAIQSCAMGTGDEVVEQRQRFYEAVVSAEPPIDLFEALLCVADGEKAQRVDADLYRTMMDKWSAELRELLKGREMSPISQLRCVSDFFFRRLGFTRVENENFFDPRNSLLNEVMCRRTGLPITLCVLYRELCLRATNIRLEGVNFPAHFLLRGRSPRTLYIDPSDPKGMVMQQNDLKRFLQLYFPDRKIELTNDMLETADEKAIIIRVLRNLKTAYLKRNENEEALSVMDRLILVSPTTAEERRDRGLLLHIMGRGKEGVRDLEFYIALEKKSPDSVVLRAIIQRYRNEDRAGER